MAYSSGSTAAPLQTVPPQTAPPGYERIEQVNEYWNSDDESLAAQMKATLDARDTQIGPSVGCSSRAVGKRVRRRSNEAIEETIYGRGRSSRSSSLSNNSSCQFEQCQDILNQMELEPRLHVWAFALFGNKQAWCELFLDMDEEKRRGFLFHIVPSYHSLRTGHASS